MGDFNDGNYKQLREIALTIKKNLFFLKRAVLLSHEKKQEKHFKLHRRSFLGQFPWISVVQNGCGGLLC